MPLSGSSVLVVGGSSGIGLAVARASMAAGGMVTIASRSQDKLDAAANTVGGRISTLVLDAGDEAQCAAALGRLGAVDHVVVTAADVTLAPFREIAADAAQKSFDSKFWGAWRVARHARLLPHGSITFTSGVWARRPSPGAAHVSAINAALEGLTRALAVELAPQRVNCVCPGIVETPAYAAMPPKERRAFFEAAAARTPTGRIAAPDDLAQAYLFCMTAQQFSGQVVVVDGGALLA